jgi:hypothetical protein
MARSRYKTLKGQVLDFDKFLAVRGSEVSVGNMGVNAKGDHINAHGDIIKTRSEIMKEKYLDPKAKYNPIRSRSVQPKVVETQPPIVEFRPQPQPQPQPQFQPQQVVETQNQPEPVQEYVKPGVIDIRHRVLGQKGFDLRGSLASAVSVDLTTPDAPKPTTLTTLRRI